jgi:hypothetical protein
MYYLFTLFDPHTINRKFAFIRTDIVLLSLILILELIIDLQLNIQLKHIPCLYVKFCLNFEKF